VKDSTQRFSDRVENYVRYRPSYPPEVVTLLREECGLRADDVIADVGSGTGILARLFLENGNRVYGVEPNRAMREAGEAFLEAYPAFTSVAGTAEATTLADHSVDVVIAGQAFHWFDQARTRQEWRRILKPEGWVALIWNARHQSGTPFLDGYEQLLREYGTDYEQVLHREVGPQALRSFFREDSPRVATFPNQQRLDYEGLKGRLLSSSYVPAEDHPRHGPMQDALRALFDRTQVEGAVTFLYTTEVYYGRL
jgi:SAM-dependent methyltransferase